MRRAIGMSCLAAVALSIPVVVAAQDPMAYAAPFSDTLETRVYPLFAMMRQTPGWAQALRDDPVLRTLAAERAARAALPQCAPLPRCLTDAWTWTDADIALVRGRLSVLMRDRKLADMLVNRQMRASRRFARYANLNDTALLAAAWGGTAAALNHVIAVYGRGEAPRYPKIDATIFNVAAPEYLDVLSALGAATAARMRPDDLFFDPSLRYAIGLLRMNERTDAGSHRPLLTGDNSRTLKAVRSARWDQKPYTALLVFGHGPEDPVSRTGVMGHIRLGIAADLYGRGLAPFLIVSGGNVHPNRTAFNEAVEMKRLLVADYHIPADRILIEPHARHTTTNLRNCARLLLAAGFPTDKPALIVSDPKTIQYIGGVELARRNVAEMGNQPGIITPGPDLFSLKFVADQIAFHVDAAADPLDP